MQNILKSTKYLILFSLFLAFIGCEGDDNTQYISGTNSVVNYLEKDENYSLFLEGIERAGLYATLDGNSGTYTVLAPDNEAIQAYLEENNYSSIDAVPDDELLRQINYHLMEILTPAENFTTGYSPTLATVPVNDSVEANLSLYVNNTIDDVRFNDKADITTKDIEVDNGIVHEIDHMLVPPTLKTFMDADENLAAFYNKITADDISTDFEDRLANPDKRTTILVPNDFAVETFFEEEGSGLSSDELNTIYRYHLLDTVKLAQNLRTGYLTTKAVEEYSGNNSQLNLYVNTDDGLFLNRGTSIVTSDLMTVNGNIQVIDSVLTLPSLADFVRADKEIEEFNDALSLDDQQTEHYFDILEQPIEEADAPFTVFAPDNTAFDDLLDEFLQPGDDDEEDDPMVGGLEDIDPNEMTAMLNLHITKQVSLKSQDFTPQTLSTLGDPIQLKESDDNGFYLQDPTGEKNMILPQDIQATNGVLHYVDRVLRVD